MKSKPAYPPITGNPRRDREAPSDAGIRLSHAQRARGVSDQAGSEQRGKTRRKRPDGRLKVTVKDRALLEEMAAHFGISMSAVLNLGLMALAEQHGFN